MQRSLHFLSGHVLFSFHFPSCHVLYSVFVLFVSACVLLPFYSYVSFHLILFFTSIFSLCCIVTCFCFVPCSILTSFHAPHHSELYVFLYNLHVPPCLLCHFAHSILYSLFPSLFIFPWFHVFRFSFLTYFNIILPSTPTSAKYFVP
jgi:hypothetical protein